VILVYIDDILLTRSDSDGIEKAKKYLKTQFVTKDMGKPSYFLGIGIAHSKHGAFFSQKMYALDLIHETRLLGCKSVRTPVNNDVNLWDETKPLFEDISQYMRLIGKLIYLTVMRPNILYVLGLVSQFMHKSREIH